MSEFLAREGQFLLPMLDLITQAEMAVDELIDVAGRATIEAVLTLSAQDLAGAAGAELSKMPGDAFGAVAGAATSTTARMNDAAATGPPALPPRNVAESSAADIINALPF